MSEYVDIEDDVDPSIRQEHRVYQPGQYIETINCRGYPLHVFADNEGDPRWWMTDRQKKAEPRNG